MNDPALMPLDLPPVSATDQVFAAVYDAVISLKLPPGTKISETEIARQLDVSRQPVRDAFFRLSKLGFLMIRPQRATLITKISEQAVLNAVFTRTALEVECLREACLRAGAADIAALDANLEQQRQALTVQDPALFHAIDDAFHALICETAGHAHVWALIQEQKAHMDRIRFLTLSSDRQREVLGEHEALVAAIKAGDVALAEESLRGHLGKIRSVIARVRRDHPDYVEAQP